MNMTKNTSKLTLMAMLCALAFVAVVAIRIPLIPMLPFLEYEPKDIIILTGGFLFGPMSAALISVIVSFIEMFTISSTGIIGLIMNVLSTVAFVCPAAYLYKKQHSLLGAFLGMVAGTLLMTLVMVLWNYLITPIYMGYPREAVVKLILPAFVPFNLLKGGINTALTLLIYKPLVTTLRKSNLMIPATTVAPNKRNFNFGMTLTAAVILITCILAVLVMKGMI
ncbi:MAG TPA: ECF transporter S component [Lachnoclostridium sp.]|jgi:riboflavin transporter FmnP|uniref:ECF transporter S component n=1 Tax=Lacrimispora sp. TaxID=2719234 RepID=UPI000EEE80A7|nr:ECF transporter S component [Lacrimispora sp.]HCD42291.1 ECF transporter S component [Lachnoclostridium sp.]